MEKDTIEKLVISYIEQDKDGLEIENPKCDFKSKWYNLKADKEINEFLKDTCAIANTFGPDGLIIIGYDLKTKTFTQASFSDSNLKDSSYISDIINRKIDRLFDIAVYDLLINGNKVSVIHIPPSIDKPHIIRNYQIFDKHKALVREEQHKVFVRKNTSTFVASKNDFELMYYDRKNIVPDYKLLCSFHKDTLNINAPSIYSGDKREHTALTANINLVFENLGKRPVAIIELSISFTLYKDPSPHEIVDFSTGHEYRSSEIIIQPNQIVGIPISFNSDFYKNGFEITKNIINEFRGARNNIITNYLTVILSTGEKLRCEVKTVSS